MDSNFKNIPTEQIIFSGFPVNKGIVNGKAFILKNLDIAQIKNNKRSVNVVEAEYAKIDFAVKITRNQIIFLIENAKKDNRNLIGSMFNAILSLSEDPNLLNSIKETIKRKSINCESVIAEEIINLRKGILKSNNNLQLKLFNTLEDLYYRILYNLIPSNLDRINLLRKIEINDIIITDRLTPIEVAEIPAGKVAGIILEDATKNSHAVLMLRILGVPVIINIPEISSMVNNDDSLIIDGYEGYVILKPDEDTVKRYKILEKSHKDVSIKSKIQTVQNKFYTLDNFEINLMCNASNLSDIKSARSQGITDIGLFRSEMFYLLQSSPPTDEQEKAFYRELLDIKGMNTFSIRFYDIGGDKTPIFFKSAKETNPDLGNRGIRFLLSHPEIMRKQLDNILKCRQSENLRLILPFITSIDDLDGAKRIIFQTFKEMQIPENIIKIGIMVEIPSAAMSIEKFLPDVDFINIGTNDLLQYFFAVNRDQPELVRYNKFTHPAFIDLLKNIIMKCENQKKQVVACGEMASHPLGSMLLVALGVKYLSVPPEEISQIYNSIKDRKLGELRMNIPEFINFKRAEEVEKKLHLLGF